jgi:hypothetical protein
MNANDNSRYSLYFKREFVCGKCGEKEFVLGKQPYSRLCEKCGSDEERGSLKKVFRSFFIRSKELVNTLFF